MARKRLMRIFEFPADRGALERRLRDVAATDPKIEKQVGAIVRRVRRDGAKALVAFAEKFDGVRLSARSIRVRPERLKKAWESLPADLRKALRLAKRRIEAFHRRQRQSGWTMRDKTGATLTQRVMPLQSVGVYIPGFLAAYPSTVLMNAVPAKIAGVKRIVAVTPPIGGRKENEAILGVAHLVGLSEVYQVGGAQAVAALAYGANPVPAVDKVVGPGNVWVQTAKRMLYGVIDIDMVAGPTEVLVVADRSAPPNLVAADLISQAEHETGTSAWAILIGPYDIPALENELRRQIAAAPRREIIESSLRANGAIVRVRSRSEAVELANQRAPEHMSVLTRAPEALGKKVHSAGAIFLGPWTPESVGDYVAGPNHVLPTGRTARFFSPLSVGDFTRTDHMVELTRKALKTLAPATIAMAEAEGLPGHAQAVRERQIKW
jgi:histidinol dehydrogenase